MELKINGHTIVLHDNTQNLPILKFQKLNKYMMISNEVGNTFEDYDARMAKALSFLQKDMVSEAIQELSNQRQMVFNAFNEYTPKGKAFAVLVKSIDGIEYKGTSPSDFDKVLEHLNDIGFGQADSVEKLLELKKKLDLELQVYFPSIFKNQNLNVSGLRINRMNIILDAIINQQKDIDKDSVYKVEKEILQNDKPNSWNIHQEENMEKVMEVDFHKFAVEVAKEKGLSIEDVSTFTFYASYESLMEKNLKTKGKKQNYG